MKQQSKRKKRLLTSKKSVAAFLSITLATGLLCGCSPGSLAGTGVLTAFGNAVSQAAALLPAGTPAAQTEDPKADEAFDALTDSLTEEMISSSLINQHLLITDPAALGYQKAEKLYDDISMEALQASMKQSRNHLEALKAISKQTLSADRQLTYEILEDYLNTELQASGLEGYFQPLSPVTGMQAQLPVLFAEMDFNSLPDVEDYFSLLLGLGDYFGSLLSWEQRMAKDGLMMPDRILDQVIASCDPYLQTGEDCLLSGTFAGRLDSMTGSALTEEKKAELTARHQELIETAFVPAYQSLIEGLQSLKGSSQTEGSLCSYPDGKKYYEYLVKSATATSCQSISSLEKTIEKRITSDLKRMGTLLSEHPELQKQAADPPYAFTDPEEILKHLQSVTQESFPEPVCQNFKLHSVPSALESVLSPAFYLIPPLDHQEDQVIYINGGSNAIQNSLYSTLGHEGFPGHLYQTAYFYSKNPAPVRRVLSYPAYSEGWGTYAEFYSFHMDSGLSDPLAEYLELSSSVSLGIHAYLDLMVGHEGWDLSRVSDYLNRYFSSLDPSAAQNMYDALIGSPTNYLSYYTGYLEFTDMKQLAKDTLGEKYEEKRFHQFLLDLGPSPFKVIRIHLKNWIKEERHGNR